jgi:4-carboxymuconolactone decarboxylase
MAPDSARSRREAVKLGALALAGLGGPAGAASAPGKAGQQPSRPGGAPCPPATGSISFDITEREAHVVGAGPRIDAIPAEKIGGETWEVVNRIRAAIGLGPATELPEYTRMMVKHPAIFQRQMEMGTTIFQGQLPARERELAVLRIAWLSRAPYEWGEHVGTGKRYGLTAQEVDRVTKGSSAPGWTMHEAAILRGVEELLADQALSDPTYAALAKSWSEPQLIEYLMMVGQYVATAFIQNSLRARLAPDNRGLASR